MSGRFDNFLHAGTTALFAAGIAACSGNVVTTSDASTSTTQALLSVERTVTATDAPSSVRSHASAYFLRLQAGADRTMAARLVGAAAVLPATGQCQPVQMLGDPGMPLASLDPVDLVDVGEVAIEASQVRATLAARAFPDVVDLVSGVVYTTRDLMGDPLPGEGAYTFRISGSYALPAMALEGRAPGPLDPPSHPAAPPRPPTRSPCRANPPPPPGSPPPAAIWCTSSSPPPKTDRSSAYAAPSRTTGTRSSAPRCSRRRLRKASPST